MVWNSNIIAQLEWSGEISNREQKQLVADKIATKAKHGQVISAGSGSTSYLALLAIAARIKKEHLDVKFIPTSIEIAMTCTSLGLQLTTLMENKPDWLFDGADEVSPENYLIKGRGGAMFKEKLLMNSCDENYIIVDPTKVVKKLGSKFPVPIEVFPQSITYVEKQLQKLGVKNLSLRPAKGKDGPVISENGNLIFDAWFENIGPDLEIQIKSITGVIESGLFQRQQFEILM
ncbi:ribose 5-phosphate isomerase A [Pedobacter sp. PWIIR3]